MLVGGDTPLLQRIGTTGSPDGLATADLDGGGRPDFAVGTTLRITSAFPLDLRPPVGRFLRGFDAGK